MLRRLAVFAALLLVFLLPACTSPAPGGARTLKQTEMYVSWPMTRFHNAVAAGVVTLAEKERVNTAYSSYQAAYRDALQTANNNSNAPPPDNVKALASKVIEAVAAISY
jgi:hypothetical protein